MVVRSALLARSPRLRLEERSRALRHARRFHGGGVLWLIALVEVAWLCGLGYGVFRLIA